MGQASPAGGAGCGARLVSSLHFSGHASSPHGPDFAPEMWGGRSHPRASEQQSGHPAQPPPCACTSCAPLGPASTPGGPRTQLGATDCTAGRSPGWAPRGEEPGRQRHTPWSTLAISTRPLPRRPARPRRNRCDSSPRLAFLLVPSQTHPCGISGRWQAACVYHRGTRGLPQAHLPERQDGGGGAERSHSVRNLQGPAGRRLRHRCTVRK